MVALVHKPPVKFRQAFIEEYRIESQYFAIFGYKTFRKPSQSTLAKWRHYECMSCFELHAFDVYFTSMIRMHCIKSRINKTCARYDLRKIQLAFYLQKSFENRVQWYFSIVLFSNGLTTCHAYYIAKTLLTSISTSAYYIGRYPKAATVMYASTIFLSRDCSRNGPFLRSQRIMDCRLAALRLHRRQIWFFHPWVEYLTQNNLIHNQLHNHWSSNWRFSRKSFSKYHSKQ